MRVTVFDNWYAAVNLLPDEDQEGFWTSVMRYAFDDVDPRFDGVQAAIFAMMKPVLDKSIQGQIYGALGGNGRGNTEGGKPPRKTPPENPPVKPSGKTSKTPNENLIERNRRESKEIEGEGFSFPEKKKNHSHACAGADAENSAPRTSAKDELRALLDEVDEVTASMLERRKETARLVAEAVPCPPELNIIGIARGDAPCSTDTN